MERRTSIRSARDSPRWLNSVGRSKKDDELASLAGVLTDAMAKTIGGTAFHGLRFDGRRFDCGTKIGFVAANVAFAMARDELNSDVREIIQSIF